MSPMDMLTKTSLVGGNVFSCGAVINFLFAILDVQISYLAADRLVLSCESQLHIWIKFGLNVPLVVSA